MNTSPDTETQKKIEELLAKDKAEMQEAERLLTR